MNRHLVIARREFRSFACRPRFLIMAFLPLVLVTLSMGSSIYVLKLTIGAKGSAFVFSDAQGALAREFSKQIEQQYPSVSEASRPAALSQDVSADDFRKFAEQTLGREVDTGKGKKPLSLIVWAPPDRSQIKVWATEEAQPLVQPFRQLSERLSGGAPTPNIEFTFPHTDPGKGALVLRRLSGIAFAYLVFIIVAVTSTALLQSMTEEKSSRLMESLLALSRPQEIFGGKLLGMAAVALLMCVVWAAVMIITFQFLSPDMQLMIHRSLTWLSSPQGIFLAVFYFLCAYLMMAMPLLVVGAMSQSAQDSGPFQFPIILLFVPILVFLSVNAANADTHYLTLMSWVPIYTPFAMPTRLGEHVALLELVGMTITMLAFMVIEYKFAGYLVRSSLLKSGPRPVIRKAMALR